MTLRYSRRALAQITEILETIPEDAPRVRQAFSRRLETLASLLARQPAIGRRTDLTGVRVFAVRPYPYLLFYRIDPNDSGITVLRIRHMARKEDWRTGQ